MMIVMKQKLANKLELRKVSLKGELLSDELAVAVF